MVETFHIQTLCCKALDLTLRQILAREKMVMCNDICLRFDPKFSLSTTLKRNFVHFVAERDIWFILHAMPLLSVNYSELKYVQSLYDAVVSERPTKMMSMQYVGTSSDSSREE